MKTEKSSLDNYIVQLTESLREAAKNPPDPNVITEFDGDNLPEELKMFADVERYMHGKPKKLSFITGIETERFPPPNSLTEAQLTLLVSEINYLLAAYNFHADFPEGLPDFWKYKMLINQWEEEVIYMGGTGFVHFEFCYYEPTDCPFPEKYCTC